MKLIPAMIVIVLSTFTSEASDGMRWTYRADQKRLYYAIPDSGAILTYFTCTKPNEITESWLLNIVDTTLRNGQHIQIKAVSKNKNFVGDFTIEGKVERIEETEEWWLVSEQPTNAESILFNLLKSGAPVSVRGKAASYTLTSRGSTEIDRLQRACLP